jgi:hypothetical protein
MVGVVLTTYIRWAANHLTEAERRLIGNWSWNVNGTAYHRHQFHLHGDHSYTETTWSDGEWHEVFSGRWNVRDGAIRLHEDSGDSLVKNLELRWRGKNVAVLQILDQRHDRLVLQFPGNHEQVWTRSEVVP